MPTTSSRRVGTRAKKSPLDKGTALRIASSVPSEKGFHFFTEIGSDTGTTATSIFDFTDQLKKVDLKSLEFHALRNDFSRWLKEVIQDDMLASEFEKMHAKGLMGERLRDRLTSLAAKRSKELTSVLKSSA
jgi:hypothetical protein